MLQAAVGGEDLLLSFSVSNCTLYKGQNVVYKLLSFVLEGSWLYPVQLELTGCPHML